MNKRKNNVFSTTSFFIAITDKNRVMYSDDDAFCLKYGESIIEKKYIEYIGSFKGKNDVIRISTNNKTEYATFVDSNTIMYYENIDKYTGIDKMVWKLYYNNTLELYYKELKKKGVVLQNDVYGRRAALYKEVYSRIV